MPADAPQSIAFIALGSNLGNREEHLRGALLSLRHLGKLNRISSFYETEPVGDVAQPDFLNAVAKLQTQLPPEELLSALLQIEQEHGRDRNIGPSRGPRTLDLDLLSHDNVVVTTPTLTLPHPAITDRSFVLVPLAEIATEWRHPMSGETAMQLLTKLRGEKREQLSAVRKYSAPPQFS